MRLYTQILYHWSVRTAGNGFVLHQLYRFIAKKCIIPQLNYRKSLSVISATMFTAHHRPGIPIGNINTLTKSFQDNMNFIYFSKYALMVTVNGFRGRFFIPVDFPMIQEYHQ